MVVCFFEFFMTPFILRRHNFFNFILFLVIFNALNAPIGGVQVLIKHKKQWTPPFGCGMLWMFKCYNCNSITINEQLKDLTHVLYLQISSYVFTLKYMCHLGMSLKKFNLKVKHKIQNKISWLFFSAISLVFSYLLICLPM